ncbi:carbohydrate ABC transporter permease [Halanaerobium saccharolyticum]|uniref:carbohydrate ABC transporter permease n=1 Tax=Halanaerobium saccharolyticum TaxID=43595 RepID=UPI003FCC61C5
MYNDQSFLAKLKSFSTFALIPLLVFFAVVGLPFIFGLLMTFTDWTGFGQAINFTGLENYRVAFNDPEFWNSLKLTFKYVIYSVIITNLLAFALALIVTSKIKAKNFFRAGFFTPNLIGGVILGFIWQFVFSRILVHAGEFMQIPFLTESWLVDPNRAFWALVIVGVWKNSGYMMLIYIAGLMGLPKSVMEAASIDGAGGLQKLLKIKLPLMIPSFTISLFLTLQRSFMVFDINISLTNGGPFKMTELITLHIYDDAFLSQNFGSGQAKAFILFVIVAVIAVSQVSIMKKMEVEA